MEEGINWAVWIGITVSALLGLSGLLYNVRRDRVRVVIITEIDWERLYKKGTFRERKQPEMNDFMEVDVYRAIITNTGFVGVQIQSVEVRAVDSQQSFSLLREGKNTGKKLVDGDHEVWGFYLDEVSAAFDDVPFHASTFAVATDTAGRKYRSRKWTTIRTYDPRRSL